MKKNQQLVGISLRVDAELKKQIDALAEADHRTLSNYMIKMMRDHVGEKSKPRRNGLAVVHHEKVAS